MTVRASGISMLGQTIRCPLLVSLAACALSTCTLSTSGTAAAAEAPVNLVVITIDTLRADHVGTYGHDRPTTPTIDALARRGARFELAHSTSPWTVPSTASILTSRMPTGHGSVRVGQVKNRRERPRQLRADISTLAGVLGEAGYRTAFFSGNAFVRGQVLADFDTWENTLQNASQIRRRSASWLGEDPGAPFFLYLQPFDLHVPIEPPERYVDMFEAPSGGERESRHKDWHYMKVTDFEDEEFLRFADHKRALYDGALRYVDDEIAEIMAILSELGVAERTVVVVTSDHGEEFWDHVEIESRLDGELVGTWGIDHGHSFFQELLHVPLVVSGPGVAQGRSVRCPVSLLDLAPTVLELMGVPAGETMNGTSRAPLLAVDGRPPPCARTPVFAESPAYGVNARSVLVEGRYKLIDRSDGIRLLYDLREDPEERHNLVDEEPELASTLAELFSRTEPAQLGEEMEIDEETLEKLRALGYIE